MMHKSGVRAAGVRGRVLVLVGVVCLALVAVVASASPALAARPFEKFQGCPTEIPIVITCNYGVTSGGEFTINKTKVPINKSIVQQGGAISAGNPEDPTLEVVIGAKAGFESFQKVALNVPGGLLGFVNCTEITGEGFFEKAARESCKFVFEHGPTEVTATTEPVANESNPPLTDSHNLSEEKGIAAVLPVRIHLKNTFLGNGCYIGSEAHPIQLNLSSGTSGTLKGKRGIASTIKEEIPGEEEPVRALHLAENSLVDGTFAVPVSEGCGELFGVKGFLNGIINSKIGLPSAAGNNKAKLDGEQNSTAAEEVIRSGF